MNITVVISFGLHSCHSRGCHLSTDSVSLHCSKSYEVIRSSQHTYEIHTVPPILQMEKLRSSEVSHTFGEQGSQEPNPGILAPVPNT